MLNFLSSLRLTTALLTILALLTLAGAVIPQTGDTLALAALVGEPASRLLVWLGLTEVFQSPSFFLVLALLFVNLVACTASRLRRRIGQRLAKAASKTKDEIARLPAARSMQVDDIERARLNLLQIMKERGFTTCSQGGSLVFTRGRLGWLAGPFTHAGLFLLLAGVAVSASFGYAGDISGSEGSVLKVPPQDAAQPLFGNHRPQWLQIKRTWRESHASGQPKQWYTELQAQDESGSITGNGITSVNSPLSLLGIDYYQSDWSPTAANLEIGKQSVTVPLKQMGKSNLGAVSLTPQISLIAIVSDDGSVLRAYAREISSSRLKLLAELKNGQALAIGPFKLKYAGPVFTTTLHYKHDPGLPLTYASFAFFMIGAALVSLPRCRIFACPYVDGDGSHVVAGWEPTPFQFLAESELAAVERALLKRRQEVVAR